MMIIKDLSVIVDKYLAIKLSTIQMSLKFDLILQIISNLNSIIERMMISASIKFKLFYKHP